MTPDVVIVGAGLWGLSLAWHLLGQHGLRVRLIDRRDGPGMDTSAQTAGQIGLIRQEPLAIEAASAALEFASQLAYRRDQEAFTRSGSVTLVEGNGAAASLRATVTLAGAAGVRIQRLTSDDARRLVPGLTGDFAAAYHVPGDGYVSPRRYLQALAAEVSALGGSFEYGTTVDGLDVASGRVDALHTSIGRVSGGAFVVAAGPWTQTLFPGPLPILPVVLGQARTVADAVPSDRPVVRFPESGLYVLPEWQGHLFGRFGPHPHVADSRPTGGLPVRLEPDYRELATTRDLAGRWLPRLATLPVDHFRQGWTTFSPDGLPIAGLHQRLANVWCATACGAMGFTWATSLGSWLAASIAAGAVASPLATFTPYRFGPRAADDRWVRKASLRRCVDDYGLRPLAMGPQPGYGLEFSSWT